MGTFNTLVWVSMIHYLFVYVYSSMIFSSHVNCYQWKSCVGPSAFNSAFGYKSYVCIIRPLDNDLTLFGSIHLELDAKLSIPTTSFMFLVWFEHLLFSCKALYPLPHQPLIKFSIAYYFLNIVSNPIWENLIIPCIYVVFLSFKE